MMSLRSTTFLLAGFLLSLIGLQAHACSMYKVTVNGKTMVGCNHDTWLITPRIWFETTGYGAGFTGARLDGANGFAPQSGMNVHGLAFSRLSSATPENQAAPNKKQVVNPTLYLKDILHRCKTVDEVKNYVDQYDHSFFSEDVFIYVDRSGRYLVVEPYTTTLGQEAKYVLANFCPSQVSDFSSIKQPRYVNGSSFLKNKIDTSLSFCTALSDTMHVCRKKIGDGTLITSIWDLKAGKTNLFFYHDYSHTVQFDLKTELAKGDHILDMTSLFPPNKEFKALADFKTPITSEAVDLFLRGCFCLFFFSAIFFGIGYFINRKSTKYAYIKLLLFPLSLLLMYYSLVLATEVNIFYFPAPYKDYKPSMVTVASYIPFLLLIILIPMLQLNRKIIVERVWGWFPKLMLTLNSLTYIALIFLFMYWGLYDVFS